MTNYKPKNIIKCGFGEEIEFSIPSNAKAKFLYYYFNAATTAKSFLDGEDNLAYKVPSKTAFYLCGVYHELNGSVVSSMLLSANGTVDTNGTLKYTVPVISSGLIGNHFPIPHLPSWAVAKYVTGLDALGKTVTMYAVGFELPL